jgi:hypothetical protein
MLIAFDLDGTISKYPEKMLALACCLSGSGCDVFVLTAAAGELRKEDRPAEVRRRLLKLGWGGFRAVCCESSEKPERCKALGVDFLIDDTEFKLDGTVLLQVR